MLFDKGVKMSNVTVDFEDLCKYAHLIKPEVWWVANQVFGACSAIGMIPVLEFDDEPPRIILDWQQDEQPYFTVSVTERGLIQHTPEGASCFDHSEKSIKKVAESVAKYFHVPK